jgi:hypothetical protein
MLQSKKTAMLVTYDAPRNTALEIIINNDMYASCKDIKNTLVPSFEGVGGIGTSAEDAVSYALMYSIEDPYDNNYLTMKEMERLVERVKQIDGKITQVLFEEVPVDDDGFKLI